MAVIQSTRVPLDSGDRLTRAEFHERYKKRSDIKKAELVEGVVYVTSPVSMAHGEPHGRVVTWLGAYSAKHPHLRLGDNVTILLDARNEVQPDACLWWEEPGGPHLNEQGYIEGAPQLTVEIAVTSASYDLHDKKEAYRRNGVREYVVWRVHDGLIDWFRLRGDEYVDVEPNDDGIFESEVFPGLRLPIDRMLNGDLAGVLAVLDWEVP